MKQFFTALLLAVSGMTLAAPADQVTGPVNFADLAGVMVFENLYFAGQPNAEALAAAKAAGISVVINMRTPAEMTFDEQTVAQGLGLDYYQVPIAGANGFTKDNLRQLDALAAMSGQQKILVHCASANRAGGWLGNYLVVQQGVGVDEAFSAARKVGLRSKQIETNLRQHLNSQPHSQHPIKQTSQP